MKFRIVDNTRSLAFYRKQIVTHYTRPVKKKNKILLPNQYALEVTEFKGIAYRQFYVFGARL